MTSRWSTRPAETALAAVAGAALCALGVLASGSQSFLGIVAGAGLLVLTVADLLLRPRLAADTDGVAVRTINGPVRLPWSEVTAVRVDERTRLGLRSRTLEIDVGETILLLGRRSLGTDPRDVLARLTALRAG